MRTIKRGSLTVRTKRQHRLLHLLRDAAGDVNPSRPADESSIGFDERRKLPKKTRRIAAGVVNTASRARAISHAELPVRPRDRMGTLEIGFLIKKAQKPK